MFSGEQPVTVQADGYLDFAGENVTVIEAQVFSIPQPIELVPLGSTTTVQGVVRDENFQPIAGAVVTIGGVSGTTDANGAFSISGVAVGTQVVAASAEGYQSTSFTTEISPDMEPLTIVLFSGTATPPGLPYNLAGTVTLADAADASGVTVTLLRTDGQTVVDTFVTDSNGEYQFLEPPGTYIVRVTKQGYVGQERTVTIPPGGQVVQGVDFVLQVERSLSSGRSVGPCGLARSGTYRASTHHRRHVRLRVLRRSKSGIMR